MEKVSEELPHPQSNISLSLLWKHTIIDQSFITISPYCYLKTCGGVFRAKTGILYYLLLLLNLEDKKLIKCLKLRKIHRNQERKEKKPAGEWL